MLLDEADGQIKCPLSSRQEMINLHFCWNAKKKCGFAGPGKVLAE